MNILKSYVNVFQHIFDDEGSATKEEVIYFLLIFCVLLIVTFNLKFINAVVFITHILPLNSLMKRRGKTVALSKFNNSKEL